MAKKKRQTTTRFSIQGFDLNHYRTTEQYAAAVQALFDRATLAIARSAASRNIDPDKPFSFDDYPEVKAELQKVVGQLASQLQTTIETGSKKQWLFACDKNDGFIDSIMDTSKLSKARLKKMQDRNLDALSTFQGRKVSGMDLSQRVWRYVGQFKEQLESALDVGLGEGRSAQELARDVKKNLREPDRLFRRVRDKRGNLVLSKAARAYHPGQGVYRSSVKNAQRLTRSEINMAYRESDFLRWQQLDFVVGFEIHRSNHEPLCKCKMCDRLQGRYPKTFKFKGWHPQCMCYAVPILADEETFDENELGDLKAALRGTEYKKKQSKNLVTDVPDGFKEWVAENMEASAGWSSTPYFIQDNFVDGDLSKGLKIALPTVEPDEPIIDPVQAKLDALMPSIEAARTICQEWGIKMQESRLNDAIANKDIKTINGCISAITSLGTKYSTKMSVFFDDAAKIIKEMTESGGDFANIIAELTQYMNNLKKDKTMWVDGASFYQSELAKAKEKLKQYLTSPESRLTEAQKETIKDLRQMIKDAEEWGINTNKARQAIQDFLDGFEAGKDVYTYKMDNEWIDLDDKIDAAKKKCDKFIDDARALIKDADNFGLDMDDNRNELSKWIFSLSGSGKAYTWATFKRDINNTFQSLKATVEEARKKKAEEDAKKAEAERVNAFDEVNERLSKTTIIYNEVKKHEKEMSESDIISRVSGGDMTTGSCASLAFVYAANKAGLDVLDFRDGESRSFFANYGTIGGIAGKVGGIRDFNVSGIDMMKKTEIGKEYYLASGGHAAIVRQVSKGKYEYLELQSGYSNGWKHLDSKVFASRFGSRGRGIGVLIEIGLFMKMPGFQKMMGYINTNESEQKKGKRGSIK